MRIEDPFHEGELRVQELAGARDDARHVGRAIATTIVRGALPFLAEQRLLVVGTVDARGQPWASALFGEPGFVAATETTVAIDRRRAVAPGGDPLFLHLARDPRVALLALEAETRRRLRINGRARVADDALTVDVRESFPNCPRHITRRRLERVEPATASGAPTTGRALTDDARALIARADTFFIASAHAGRGADVSHRGGPPGFVGLTSPTRLRVPDYAGNGMFQTLGNLALDPRAGLLFLDHDRARALQVAGTVAVDWNDPERRAWDLEVDEWREAAIPARLAWRALEQP